MPLYEYKCGKCSKVFEVIQKFADAPLEVHPGCGGRVERLLSAPALQFKGSGWYVTDYGRNGGNGSGAKDKSKTETPDSKKTETTKPPASPAKESASSSKPD